MTLYPRIKSSDDNDISSMDNSDDDKSYVQNLSTMLKFSILKVILHIFLSQWDNTSIITIYSEENFF